MDEFLSPSDFDVRFPPLSHQDTEAGFDLPISQVQKQILRIQEKAWGRTMPFSKWWFFVLTTHRINISKPRISAQEEQARRFYRGQLRSNAVRRQDVKGFVWMTVEWGGDIDATLSLPPLVAPRARYVLLGHMWPHLGRGTGNARSETNKIEAEEEETDVAASGAIEFTFEDVFDLDKYYAEEDSTSNAGQQKQLEDYDSAGGRIVAI
ncbi:hypothetical protein BST61_g6629 [Cercospora zeina]